ncbi:rhamnosyltransferase WsaF family glycosyltransferase [Vibrio sp. McD22-P3]|uniref:rhamnosyltransferase WsaF family glycosyltransferase n=1 Tax=Vibrio sp. McD22-P3 TaxID=2724880 RepID=UPI001F1FC0A4|nr:hypothetical protein [Vibrio sp. McD22-P3]MCF4175272.1 hypothetical protein [Vibrio sp. McD22-P3]
MINWLINHLLKNRYVYDKAKNAYNRATKEQGRQDLTDIPEATPFRMEASEIKEARINLLVPALSEQHVFGGISTALRFYEELIEYFPSARIIVTDETSTQLKDKQYYSSWKVKDIGEKDISDNVIVVAGNRIGKQLFIRENDYFVSTAWWTAINAFRMLDWQEKQFSLNLQRKQVYFIQDYEPGFYAWSARYALADATYRKQSKTIAIFNTKLLSEYFSQKGYNHEVAYHFDPVLNPVLKAKAEKSHNPKKLKRILFYGRPSVERNLFPLIIQSLRLWVENNPNASDWEVLSAGEDHEPIDLGRGVMAKPLGKLSLEEYSKVLEETSVGVSLMLSPHPSYPPLEMAAFGVRVVTNNYENKDLTKLVSNLDTPVTLDPQDISLSIANACDAHDEKSRCEIRNDVFTNESSEFPFVKQVANILISDTKGKDIG